MINRPRLVACTLCAITILLSVASSQAEAATSANQTAALKESLKELEPCVLNAVFSFLYPASYLPTTSEALDEACKRQSEAFKCVKEKSTGTPIVVKRGMATLMSIRKKTNKKYCSNLASRQSKRVVADFKCVREKKFSHYRAIEALFVNTMFEIERRNYNDSKVELKYFCCGAHKFRKDFSASSGKECPMAEETMREIISSIVPDEITLICDDEERLAKTCNELEPIKVSTEFDTSSGHSPVATGLFLVATLGESN